MPGRKLTTFAFAVAVAAGLTLVASPVFANPQIRLYRAWDGLEVPNGSSFAYPNTPLSTAHSRLFRIENPGTSTLTISNHTSLVSGTGFSQIVTPTSTVAPGGNTTFRIRFTRAVAGMFFGQISIASNAGPSPYVVHLIASAGTFAPPAQAMFVLSSAERNVWNPPGWTGYQPPPSCSFTNYPWNGWEGAPLKYVWDSFCFGQARANPLHPTSGTPGSWYDPNGTGSQNHAMLWLGASALGNALTGNVASYDLAAQKAIEVLALDLQPTGQGHMRHEAIGSYNGFWAGGVAAMALAGRYQPMGAVRGAELLAAAQSWWRDHVGALRQLRLPDGQTALVGARLKGLPGVIDDQSSMTAAVHLQLADPLPYSQLHPWLQGMLSSTNQPGSGFAGASGNIDWRVPRQNAEQWLVLRAIQLGALPSVSASHPVPCLAHRDNAGQPANVSRWTAGGRTHTALPWIYGYYGVRWHVSWGPQSPYPGNVLRVEAGTEPTSGKGPHKAPSTVQIPSGAQLLIPGC